MPNRHYLIGHHYRKRDKKYSHKINYRSYCNVFLKTSKTGFNHTFSNWYFYHAVVVKDVLEADVQTLFF